MTDDNMTIRLADLYRLAVPAPLDAGDLVRYVRGELPADEAERVKTVLASSPEQAALTELLAELAPDASRLAAAVDTPETAHHRHSRHAPRHAVGHRVARRHHRLRWLGAAAVLAMTLGMWGWHHFDASMSEAPAQVASPALQHVESDGIFDSGMDGHAIASSADDEIFRASFNRKS